VWPALRVSDKRTVSEDSVGEGGCPFPVLDLKVLHLDRVISVRIDDRDGLKGAANVEGDFGGKILLFHVPETRLVEEKPEHWRIDEEGELLQPHPCVRVWKLTGGRNGHGWTDLVRPVRGPAEPLGRGRSFPLALLQLSLEVPRRPIPFQNEAEREWRILASKIYNFQLSLFRLVEGEWAISAKNFDKCVIYLIRALVRDFVGQGSQKRYYGIRVSHCELPECRHSESVGYLNAVFRAGRLSEFGSVWTDRDKSAQLY
jgi:hypothetical protein